MPMYDYQCPAGHVSKDVFHLMHDETPICCATCGEVMAKLPSLAHTDLKDFHKPIEMFSVGCNSIDEIRQMQAAGIECSDDPENPLHGVPIVHNRHEKLQALKIAGFQETK